MRSLIKIKEFKYSSLQLHNNDYKNKFTHTYINHKTLYNIH